MHPQWSCHLLKESSNVIKSVTTFCRTALDYRSYSLSDRHYYCDDNVAGWMARIARRLEVQLKLQTLESSDPISKLSSLLAFQLDQDTNRIYKSAASWLLHSSMYETAGVAQTYSHVCPVHCKNVRKETNIVLSSSKLSFCIIRSWRYHFRG